MKKLISLCQAVIFVISLAACDSLSGSDDPDNAAVSLSVLCVNTNISQNFVKVIQTHFPEVDLQIEYYAAGNNTSEYIVRLLESGNGPDIVYTGTVFEEKLQKEYLLDLSAYDFAGRTNGMLTARSICCPGRTPCSLCFTTSPCLRKRAGRFPPQTTSWLLLQSVSVRRSRA